MIAIDANERTGLPLAQPVAALPPDTWTCSESERAGYQSYLADIVQQHAEVRGIVVLAPTIDWALHAFQRPHQLAQTFARQGYLVFFCISHDSLDASQGFQRVEDGLYLSRVPAEVLSAIAHPIVIVLPYNTRYLRHFTDPCVVYDYLDELEVFPYDLSQLRLAHVELLHSADVVIVTAERLLNQVKGIRPDAILASNAADYYHFAPARQVETRAPADLQSLLALGHPIVGYYGLLADWFDFELLQAVAQARPDLEFVMIGKVRDGAANFAPALQGHNIHWLDSRPYNDLPAYLRYFDVAIIPFKVNQITLATSPLKLFEYMAGHKPVVSTALPECARYSPVLIASGPAEFSAAIDRALGLRADPQYLAQLDDLARANSWNARVMQITDAVARLKEACLNSPADGAPLARGGPGMEHHLLGTLPGSQSNSEAAPALAASPVPDPALRARVDELEQTLEGIYQLKAWKLMSIYWRGVAAPGRLVIGSYQALRAELRRLIPFHVRQAVVLRVRGLIRRRSPAPVAPTLPAARQGGPRQYDIILFPIIDWDFRFQRPQQLLTQFAQNGHRCFYLNTVFQEFGPAGVTQQLAERIVGVQLPGRARLNLYRDQLAPPTLDQALAALDLLRRQDGIDDAVCLVQLPFWSPLALAARELWGWKIVYDCLDEHSGFGTMSPELLDKEARLVETSDLTLATSHLLYQRVKSSSRTALLLPNAADFDHFHQRPPVLPLADWSHPIIGYYGAIAEWFDVDLLRAVAAARPDWQFVLIGSTAGADVTPLRSLSNIHMLGEKSYAELPGYLHGFDVACIPFKVNPLTEATNPVKFYEYLSAGKPVVAVELPELQAYRDDYYPAGTADEFIRGIETALGERPAERVEGRFRVARQNTWAHRYQTLQATLRSLYGKAVVIIVSFDNLDYLQQCLDSLFAKTAYPNFEVVVVDNGSGPQVTSYLASYARAEPRLKVVFNGANFGFARANNVGIRAAGQCDYVVLLNNDTIVTPGWLSKFVGYLGNPQVGMVGPVTNGAGNEARIDVTYQSVAELDRFAVEYTSDKDRLVFDIPMLAMYCVAMRRPLLDEIGPLDERFGIGMFEDDDFSFRVKKAGYRVICATDVYIHHWLRASFKKLPEAQYHEIFELNRKQFEDKWGISWQAHQDRRQAAPARLDELPKAGKP